jgi:TolA-binding protein
VRRTRRVVAVVTVAALLVLAGCSGAGGGDGGAPEAADAAGASAVDRSGDDAGAAATAGDDDALEVANRQIIRTGRVVVTVGDYDRARRNLTAATRETGGFVAGSNRRRHDRGDGVYVTGELTLRVPSERFGRLMDRAEAVGVVESSRTRTEDVTEQVTDLDARLRTLRAQRERLRGLYERANDTEEVLAVERRLAETQERIERLETRRESLRRQVQFSTVTVELREERPDSPVDVERWYDAPLVGAFFESVDGVVVTARALSVVLAYALPYLLAFGLPVGAVGVLAYRRVGDRGDASGAVETPEGEDSEAADDADDPEAADDADDPEAADDGSA